ncbi:hypothetical protein LBSP_19640 [Lentilactobacillus buchneri subsp. silagei]|nr:hypothetical protein LBSP_19640 [Lentilactobacillus buchneri subsp. silagei]
MDGEYGLHDVYIGSPAVVNASGIQKVVEVPLNADEAAAMKASAETLQKTTADGMAEL